MIRVHVSKTSDYKFKEDKTFKDAQEMIEYGLKDCYEIVISHGDAVIDKKENYDYKMEIYDDYRE